MKYLPMKTKHTMDDTIAIIAGIDDYDKLKEMVLHGLDCCRLNFSHGTYEEQLVRIERIKKLRTELGRSLPILLDTKGPEISLRTNLIRRSYGTITN